MESAVIQATEKAEKRSLSQKAYDQIKKMILTMEIKPGQRIPEERIVGFVGGSRTPVREALQALANEGLVNIYPRRYSEVAHYNDAAVREVGVYRLSQDLLACQLAILNGTSEDFEALKVHARQCEEGALQGNVYDRISYDSAFHLEIARIGGNTELIRQQTELYQKIHLIHISKYTDIANSLEQIRLHWDIIEGLKARDYDRVSVLVCDHLQQFYNIDADVLRFFKRGTQGSSWL